MALDLYAEIEHRVAADQARNVGGRAVLAERVRSVRDAYSALDHGEEWSAPALRSALVDLAAISIALTADLPLSDD